MTVSDGQRWHPTRRSLLGGAAATAAVVAMPRRPRGAEPIRIGFPAPLTGPYGTEAADQVRCAELAVQEFNEAGGLDGRMAELLVRDDKLNPGEAATRSLELIENDGIHVMCGGLSASVQLAINAVCRARGIVYNSISQSDAINEAADFSRYTFHEALNPYMTAGAVVRYTVPRFGPRVAILAADYAFGAEVIRGIESAGAPLGIEVAAKLLHPLGVQDFSPYVPQISARRPDILYLCNFGRDQLNAIKQLMDFGVKRTTRIVCPIISDMQRLAASAETFEEVLGGANYYWRLEDNFDSARAFNERYRAANAGRPPSAYGGYGYAGVKVLLEGIRKAGTTDGDTLSAALEELRYDVYKGPEYFRGCDHQAVQSVLVLESRPAQEMENPHDIFRIAHIEGPDDVSLRSCTELGHTA